MAKKTQRSKPVKAAASRKTGSKKPAQSTKKKPASRAAKSSRSPRATSTKRTTRRTTKQTARSKPPARKSAKRSSRRSASKSARTGKAIRKTVDGYVSTLNDWRKECVGNLRKIIRKAAPGSLEMVKWAQPVYEHHGPFAWIKAHAKHVNLGFWRGVELPDPRKLLEGTGKKMRHIKLSSLKDAGKRELQEFVRLAARLNEIKGSPTRRGKPRSKRK
jgi:hypothetical protein